MTSRASKTNRTLGSKVDDVARMVRGIAKLRSLLPDAFDEQTSHLASLSIAQRLALLDEYLPLVGDEKLSSIVTTLFPEINTLANTSESSPRPRLAPAKWPTDRHAEENPADFVRRVYGPWIGQGLTKADVRRLDPTLYRAIFNWQRKNPWPADLVLPTLKSRNDAFVEGLRVRAAAGVLHGSELPQNAKETRRLAGLLARRNKS